MSIKRRGFLGLCGQGVAGAAMLGATSGKQTADATETSPARPPSKTALIRNREDGPIPEGITMNKYFEYANVEHKFHCFRPKRAVPWLAKVFAQ